MMRPTVKRRPTAHVLIAALALGLVMGAGAVAGQEIERNPIPGSRFPISQSVEIPAGAEFMFVSGQVPPVVDKGASRGSIAAHGDIATQTAGVIRRIQSALKDQGWSLGDVVMLRVYLAPDPSVGFGMDFRGFMQGYTQFFGTESQPNLPARSVVPVATLAVPGWLVEIDAVAARVPALE